jgi:hypothetical protein
MLRNVRTILTGPTVGFVGWDARKATTRMAGPMTDSFPGEHNKADRAQSIALRVAAKWGAIFMLFCASALRSVAPVDTENRLSAPQDGVSDDHPDFARSAPRKYFFRGSLSVP